MNSPTILLVEDDENDIFLVRHAFQQADVPAALSVARDGQEAIEYLAGEGQYSDRSRYPLPCVIILDLKMPRIGGLDFLTWLRQQPDLQTLPVIIHSSSALEGDVDRAYRIGVNAFVSKPTSVKERVELARHIKGFWLHFNEPPSLCQSVVNVPLKVAG